MAPKLKKNEKPKAVQPEGIFSGMVVFMVNQGVQARRLQIWKQKLEQMGAKVEDSFTGKVSHVLAMDWGSLKQIFRGDRLTNFNGKFLHYQWLEDSLKSGEKLAETGYLVKDEASGEKDTHASTPEPRSNLGRDSVKRDGSPNKKKFKSSSPERSQDSSFDSRGSVNNDGPDSCSATSTNQNEVTPSLTYNPPDMNRDITDIFKKLIDIYRALGDDRRSFSYYKAIPVIEKLPFRIESAEQIKHLPAIGKSLQDHIMEIVTSGKLSKLEHFEHDEKVKLAYAKQHSLNVLFTVKTISLFGEVWGIGPATALKLYDKGHRTLKDLETEESLTKAQTLGLKYFDDIKTRIPRHEVEEMEKLLQKAAEDVRPGMIVICGGSFRRGKSSCGDMDIVITHPDGQSHKGFLSSYVKHLKDINFLREDLVFTTHSEEGTDSGVDTYFGLCTYPGRELRHRIDLKVYPREIYAFGLIAWTGNDTLNRRLRILAESKGFRLDDTGLFPATHGSSGRKGTRATASLHLKTEKEVFDFLGFPWLEPNERNL